MQKIRTIIVDDEPMARGVIKKHLEKLDNYELVAECANAIEAINKLQTEQIDLMFLDIQMPHLTGLEFLKTLKTSPMVVLATAYSEFGVDSYEFENVVDYLLKPISFERFLKTSNRISEKFLARTRNSALPELALKETSTETEQIQLKADKKVYNLNLSDIIYFQAYGNYVKVHTETIGMILVFQKFQDFEDTLPTKAFARIHKSFIVNLSKINYVEGNQLFINKTALPIGITYKKSLKFLY
jgi:DNA-binding LytR/AlgR family response regulator